MFTIEDETRVGPDGKASLAYVLKDEYGNPVAEIAYPVEVDYCDGKVKEFERLVLRFAVAPDLMLALTKIASHRCPSRRIRRSATNVELVRDDEKWGREMQDMARAAIARVDEATVDTG